MIKFFRYLRQYAQFQRNARLYLLAIVVFSMSSSMAVTIYSLYLSALGYATDFIGVILLFAMFGGSIALIPAGLCIDRFNSRPILIWSCVLILLTTTGKLLLLNPTWMCICAFFMGIGLAFVGVLHSPFLTRNSTPDERIRLFGVSSVLSLATIVLGEALGGALPLWLRAHSWAMFPQLSWLLAPQLLARSYQITMLLSVLFMLPIFIPLFLLITDRPTDVGVVEQPLRLLSSSMKRIFFLFLKRFKHDEGATVGPNVAGLGFWQRVHAFLLSPLVMIISVNVLMNIGTGMLSPYFSLFFVQHLGATSALFGVIDGLAQLLNAVGILLAPWLVMRVGRVRAILLPRLLAIPLLLCIAMPLTIPLVAVCYPLRQFMTGMPNGLWQAFSMEVLPDKRRGLANSGYQGASQIAWATAAPIGGVMIHKMGYTPVFWIAALCSLLALVLFWWRFGGKRFVTAQEPSSTQQAA